MNSTLARNCVARLIFSLVALATLLHSPAHAQTAESSPEVQWTDPENPTVYLPIHEKANDLQTAAAIYEFVRNEFRFVPYHGARSNSINTFLGRMGNDLDLASTLIAMLRSQNIPARYAVGDVTVDRGVAARWMGGVHENLALHLLQRAGVPGVVFVGNSLLRFEHVWVQALVALDDYRGEGPSREVNCIATPGKCRWVDLDPSFKDVAYPSSSVDVYEALDFNYNELWNASKPNYTPTVNPEISRTGKNPLEIFEEQVLGYLRSPAVARDTLDDVSRPGQIVVQRAGLLPSSTPFAMVGPVRTYASVTQHDTPQPPPAPAESVWGRKICLFVHWNSETTGYPAGQAALAAVSTKRLTMAYDRATSQMITRLDGQLISTPATGGASRPRGTNFDLEAWIVGANLACSDPIGGNSPRPVFASTGLSANFRILGLTVGGYFDIGTGGEIPNWSQFHRDAQRLISETEKYKVLPSGTGGDPHVDCDPSATQVLDKRLMECLPALDALTGGLLASARSLYFARLQEIVTRVSALHHTVSLIPGFVAVTSTVDAVDYLDGRPFAVMPEGLLINVAGVFDGPFRWDELLPKRAPKAQLLLGAALSSLEHEVWQELTGHNATSTISGMQNEVAVGDSQRGDICPGGNDFQREFYQPSRQLHPEPVGSSTGGVDGYEVFLVKGFIPSTEEITALTFGIKPGISLGGEIHYLDGEHNYVCALAASYAIGGTRSSFLAGGGYLSLDAPLNLFDWNQFNNEILNNQHVIGLANNDRTRTASTKDPVSTVTGNLFYDTTDLRIKGRGLDYIFTRTYNSGPTTTNDAGRPMGFGWTHSYAMKLHSNDTGQEPNSPLPGGGNTDNITSSIAYVDERGGEALFGVSGTGSLASRPVVPPRGKFETLDLSQAGTQKYILRFRNGVEYEFGNADLSVPGREARLNFIRDAYGAQLTLHYDANDDLDRISDNLSIAGRTGLQLHHVNHRLTWIRDWSTTPRQWSFDYDADGNLTSATNPLNETTLYEYSKGKHHLTAVVLPEDRDNDGHGDVRLGYDYFQDGKALRDFNALGQGESLEYNLFRHRTHVTDARGFTRAYYYNRNGELDKLEQADGSLLFFKHTAANGLRFEKTNALGVKTSYSYNTSRAILACERGDLSPADAANCATNTFGNVTREQDVYGKTIDYDYGILDQLTQIKDKRDNVERRTYYLNDTQAPNGVATPWAKAGRLYRRFATVGGIPDVLLEELEWNDDGTLHRRIEYIEQGTPARVRTTTYFYEPGSNGLNVSETRVQGSGKTIAKRFAYDELGRIRQEILSRNVSYENPTTMVDIDRFYYYDALDRVTEIRDELLNSFRTVYDRNGNTKEIWEDWAGPPVPKRVSARQYDAADRLIEEKDVFGKATTYAYDAGGNLIERTDANGNSIRFEYDAMGRQLSVVDANENRVEKQYDQAGRLTRVKDANGITTEYEYDKLDQLVAVSRPTEGNLVARTEYGHDENGNQVWVRDPNAAQDPTLRNDYGATEYRYFDELNRLSLVYDANWTSATLPTLRYTYDLLGNRTSVRDPLLQTTTFVYNDLGQLQQIQDPIPGTPDIWVESDEAGNLIGRIDRNGQASAYKYDLLNRLTEARYLADNSVETRTYDARGNLFTVGNADVTYSYSYDDAHRLTSRSDSRNLGVDQIYTYDPVGNVQTKRTAAGDLTEYVYDGANRLVSLRNPDYVSVSYHYDHAGNVLNRTLSNGAQTDYEYDLGNRLRYLRSTSGPSTLLQDVTYGRDRNGNITSQTDLFSGAGAFGYDRLNRLRVADYSSPEHDSCFTYDAAGNRKTERIGVGGATNCLSGTPGTPTHSFVYGAGNRLQAIRDGSETGPVSKAFEYDNNGSVWRITTNGAISSTLVYDPKNRVKSVSDGTATTFKYDPFDYRIQKIESGQTFRYLLEGEHLELVKNGYGETLAKFLRGVVIDEVVNGYMRANGGVPLLTNYTFYHDGVQSVTGLSSHTGAELEKRRYRPFGDLFFSSGTPTPKPSLRYTGRELDASGLYYYRARYYDSSIGRFLQEDPLGFAAGPNFYSYVGNNPLVASDPLGLYTLQIGLAGTGILPFFPIPVSVGFGVAVDHHLNVGTYGFGGPGLGVGASVNGGVSFQFSNAQTIADLSGPFLNVSAHAGLGVGGSINYFMGQSPNGPVTGGGFTTGAALGASLEAAYTVTGVYAPMSNGSDSPSGTPVAERSTAMSQVGPLAESRYASSISSRAVQVYAK